ncbi:hypothetical protein H6P81_018240 [Aristolochia fimbriata]|uniref:UvrD-like helicase ATP-binding domain-containing protein n=1 Tax=Aristolochia fimbriata TaxID=158543 RepID=A0AAV7E1Z3_ARIFI|nr:hypothetical protein H6P81_018240 [Aristolochia fimbriata]
MGKSVRGQKWERQLTDVVLSWSIEDILDEELFVEKVVKIPETFQSLDEYFEAFVVPLKEETRADLCSTLCAISESPSGEVTSIEEAASSKLNWLLSDSFYVYNIEVDGWRTESGFGVSQVYKPKIGDLLILSSLKPERVEDFTRYGVDYCLASVTGLYSLEDEAQRELQMDKRLRILTSKNLEVSAGMGKSLFATFLTNLTTNCRIWKALTWENDRDSLHIVKAVFEAKEEVACCDCSKHDVWPAMLSTDFLKLNLNDSQKGAILSATSAMRCYHCHPVKLIWGPPGTGKTRTVAILLCLLLNMKFRALTCAPTNIAVLEVCSRFLELVKESRLNHQENIFGCCPMGDIVLFGNKDRMIISGDLTGVYLDHRVDQLTHCFAPLTGWRQCLTSMIDFLVDAGEQYHLYLENEAKNEECGIGFRSFLAKRFKVVSEPLIHCMKIMWIHLPRPHITKLQSKAFGLLNLLETFESRLSTGDVTDKELEQVFLSEGLEEEICPCEDVLKANLKFEGSPVVEIQIARSQCLQILKVLQDTLELPITLAKDSIKEFCLGGADLTFCTASSSSMLHYTVKSSFEVLIIDEAAQLKECESLIPFRLWGLQHAVLIGDECQLPSMVKSKVCVEARFGRSLFERMSLLGYPKHLLNIQYRMHPEISSFPNAKFYNNQILDGSNVKKYNYKKCYLPERMYGAYSFINITDGREEKDERGSWKNMVEVAVVLRILRSLYKAWNGTGQWLTIGVVSPYSAQVNEISEKNFTKYEQSDGFIVKVGTIDGFQGGEEDVIILSTVRSNSGGSVGFLDSLNRTNVALTRARHCLWVLGNAITLQRSGSVWEDLVHDAKKRQCFFNADEDNNLAKTILDTKHELNQLDDLLNADSILFKSAKWKILFSDDFRKSFAKLKFLQTRKAVIQLLLRLAGGWHPKSKILVFPGSFQLAKYCKVKDLSLIWMIDIAKREDYIQVIKVWDIVPTTDISKLVKRLDNIFGMYTDDYISHCQTKCFEGNIVVPMHWKLSADIIRFKKNCKAESIEVDQVDDADNYMENSKVSDSLLLMKFYSLSSGVVKHLLTADDGKEIDIPFEVNDEEEEIIKFPRSSFIMGRSGTGKTTVLTMKLVEREQQYLISSEGTENDFSHVANWKHVQHCNIQDPGKGNFLRQIFITVSPKLCFAIRSQICRFQSFISGGNVSSSSGSSEMHDISDNYIDFSDIPDCLLNVPRKHFPLVVTFRKFLMMLDGTVLNSFFDKFCSSIKLAVDGNGDSKPLALQELIERKEVNYARFSAAYWPHFSVQLTSKLDPSTVYTQIMSHIKGGLGMGISYDGILDRVGYVNLSETRISTLNCEQRERIYDIFLDYQKKKLERGEYDLSDLVIDLHHRLRMDGYNGDEVHFVYIDEVQDLTMRQIALFKYVCKNFDEGFVFAGDTAQTIARGIDFRFQDIRSLFYREFFSDVKTDFKGRVRGKEQRVSQIFSLSQNFRTHDGVLKLAQSVIDLLYRFFPFSIDVLKPERSLIYGEAPVVLESGDDENAIMTIFGNSGSTYGSIHGFGAEQVILVRNEDDKRQIVGHVGKQALVLTILECKGLEFQDVLLYNFFGASPLKNQWRIIYEYMREQNILESSALRYPKFDVTKHNVLCSELKQLYVAITRTRQRLWICESNVENLEPIFDYWKRLGRVRVTNLDSSVAEAMRAASTGEEWRSRGIKFFNEGNYEVATMCFERAGDEFREKWARAAGLFANADKIFSSNPDTANAALLQAAEIYETIGKAEAAANCFMKLKEYMKAGRIYLERCGQSRLKDAGDCFFLAESWSDAAEVYAKAQCFSKCLSACTKGGAFDMGLKFIQQWKENLSMTDVKKQHEFEAFETSFLESSAVHYLKLGDKQRMMKFVRAFGSLDLIRKFLRSWNLLDDLLLAEIEWGNYLEAADIAQRKGHLLLEAEVFEKAGEYEKAVRLILLHVVVNCLWSAGCGGWPLKPYLQEKYLIKAKSLSEKVSCSFRESVCAKLVIFSEQADTLSKLGDLLSTGQRAQNVFISVLAVRKILDFHLKTDPSKFHWETVVVADVEKHANSLLSLDSISIESLHYYWVLWKEIVLNVISYLLTHENLPIYEEFCLEYMGVRKRDFNTYVALNSEVSWIKGSGGSVLQLDDKIKVVEMNGQQFMSSAKHYWTSELLSVGMKLLEKLAKVFSYSMRMALSVFCQVRVSVHMFQISKFLIEYEQLDSKSCAAKLQNFLFQSKENLFDIVCPFDSNSGILEQMVSVRQSEDVRQMLHGILIDNLSPESGQLTYGQVGRAVMIVLVSGGLSDVLYEKFCSHLHHMPLWKLFLQQLVTYFESGLGRSSLARKLLEALDSTFLTNWAMQHDYIPPHCFIYLLEFLLLLSSTCPRGDNSFFTTKSSMFQFLICQNWSSYFGVQMVHDLQLVNTLQCSLDFVERVAGDLLMSKQGMIGWIKKAYKKSGLDYYSVLVRRLVLVVCLAHLNCWRFSSRVSFLLSRKEIIFALPQFFWQKLKRVDSGYMRSVRAVSEALESIGNPLVIVSSKSNSSKFSSMNVITVTHEVFQNREDVLQSLFPKTSEGKCVPLELLKRKSIGADYFSNNNQCQNEHKPSPSSLVEDQMLERANREHADDLGEKYRKFWNIFDSLILEKLDMDKSDSSTHHLKLQVDELIYVLGAAMGRLDQGYNGKVLSGHLSADMGGMLDDLKQLSNALDTRYKGLDYSIPMVRVLFSKLQQRKPNVQPVLDSVFSVDNKNPVEPAQPPASVRDLVVLEDNKNPVETAAQPPAPASKNKAKAKSRKNKKNKKGKK